MALPNTVVILASNEKTERSANRKGCKKQASRSISKYVVLLGVVLEGLGAVAKHPQTHFSVTVGNDQLDAPK